MQRPKIYLASGWFNPAQKNQMEEIYSVIAPLREEGRVAAFCPFWDGIVLKGKSDPEHRAKMKQAWDLDIKELSTSDLVVVATQDHDVGTIFEAGYASAKGVPILCYNSNPELGLNVMLSQEARGFCKNVPQLRDAIEAFLLFKQDNLEQHGAWRYNLWEGEPF